MLSKDVMRKPLLVDRDENIAKAVELLDRKKDTHLVVTDEGRVVGIVSVKDILRTILDRLRWGSQRASKLYVSAVMTENPIYVSTETPVYEVARLMIVRGISSVIIAEDLEDVESVGIITKRDLLKQIRSLYDTRTLISSIMTKNPVCVNPGTTVKHAEWILREKGISTLPVVEEGALVGYLDARILALEIAWAYLKGDIKHTRTFIENTTVEGLMAPPHFASKDKDVYEVAELLVHKRAKGTPILENDRIESKLIGIVTETDIVRLLAESYKD